MDAEAPEDTAWLVDVTEESGVQATTTAAFATLPDRFGGGVCVLDVDREGPLDLLFALRQGLRLYVADAPLSFVDRTVERGLDGVDDAMGCLAFDADGDGDDDLLVTALGAVRLFAREGDRFVERTSVLGLALDPRDLYASAAAGDVDADGDLDLVVAGFLRYDPADIAPGCAHCASKVVIHEPIPNLLLLREDGGYRLDTNIAPELAAAEATLVVGVTDLDGDGAIDVYVGNDMGGLYYDRALVRGPDGIYRDAYLAVGLGYDASGYGIDTMGMSSADVDGDGRIDHAVTGFDQAPTTIFLCRGGYCEPQRGDRSGTDALADTVRWGVALVDLDLDGRPDLAEATGHLYSDAHLADRGSRDQRPTLMRNVGGGRFEAVAVVSGSGRATPRSTRGIAVTDLDLDGRPDLVLAPAVGGAVLLRNQRPPTLRPLVIELEGRPPNTGGVGARVTVRAGSEIRVRDRRAGEGYLGSFSPRLHFAVPDEPARIEVRWPNGAVTVRDGVTPGERVVIRQRP